VRVASPTSIDASAVPTPAPARGHAAIVAAVLLMVALAAAISVDVVKTGYGVKSDEATYVAMALSLANDGNLSYERQDLERFYRLYRAGPDGIFLKRGKRLRLGLTSRPPFVRLVKTADPRGDRLYYGKAFIYAVAAAPFVWLFGLNGLLVLHVLLLGVVCACGYLFLSASSRGGPSLTFALAFVGASCVPVYAVFLAPEVFNFTLIFVAYFLWAYKEVAADAAPRWLQGTASDVAAALLIGAATYSKPSHALLIAPIVLWAWWRRRYRQGAMLAIVFVLMAGGLYGVNAMISGEFNYQGGDAGDRKRFVGVFPFDGGARNAWDDPVASADMTTNDLDTDNVLQDFSNRLSHNVEYFLVGRHFGFVPYFFPGVIAIGLWLISRERSRPWRMLTFLAVGASALALLIFAPYTWSGGGGPPGNRYFMSVYGALFFLTPSLDSSVPGLLAWFGGALFTAKMVMNPFAAAKFPNQTTERGFARRLPVEITMANDLPVMLEGGRAHSWYSDVLLYFLDEHAYQPEVVDQAGDKGIWIAGDGRADIIMRCEWPIDHLRVTVRSSVPTSFIMSVGGPQLQIPVVADRPATFDVPVSGVRDLRSYAYLISAQSTGAFTPQLLNPALKDPRNLGALMQFTAIPAAK
jgi:hypothetical protein